MTLSQELAKNAIKKMPDIAYFMRYIRYEAPTGKFFWVSHPRLSMKNGTEAGCVKKDGYAVITIGRNNYKAHRVAWLFHHAEEPTKFIDHINGVRNDNRPENLRLATMAENHQNRAVSTKNTSGFVGVYYSEKDGAWHARIRVLPKRIYLGGYATAEEAHAAYKAAKCALHIFNPEVPCR